jgi:hypothetical protein
VSHGHAAAYASIPRGPFPATVTRPNEQAADIAFRGGEETISGAVTRQAPKGNETLSKGLGQ